MCAVLLTGLFGTVGAAAQETIWEVELQVGSRNDGNNWFVGYEHEDHVDLGASDPATGGVFSKSRVVFSEPSDQFTVDGVVVKPSRLAYVTSTANRTSASATLHFEATFDGGGFPTEKTGWILTVGDHSFPLRDCDGHATDSVTCTTTALSWTDSGVVDVKLTRYRKFTGAVTDDNVLLSGTLTPGSFMISTTRYVGFDEDESHTSLSDDTFETPSGEEMGIIRLGTREGTGVTPGLFFGIFHRNRCAIDLREEMSSAVLVVEGFALPFSELHQFASCHGAYQWNYVPFSWAAGQAVEFKIVSTTPREEPPGLPSAPRNLHARGSATAISLSWVAPEQVGASAVTGHKIQVTDDIILGTMNWSDLEPNTMSTKRSYLHDGLEEGDVRLYRVAAINDEGTGPWSNVAEGTAENLLLLLLYGPEDPVEESATSTMTFTVFLAKTPAWPIGVHYETVDGRATESAAPARGGSECPANAADNDGSVDYVTTSGRLYFVGKDDDPIEPDTFSGQDAVKGDDPDYQFYEISVKICNDNVEDSGETFRLVLRSTQLHESIEELRKIEIGPEGRSYEGEETTSATGTITNHESTTVVSIAADAAYVEEGTEAAFTVRRTGDAEEALTVPVTVTETGATLGTPVPAGVTLAAGVREASFRVPTEDDGVVEADSTLTATLEAGFTWQLAEDASSASLTVLDNDAAPATSTSTADVTVWLADMTVVDYENGSIGAGSADLLANQGGSAGLQARWLYYESGQRKLKIAFNDGLDDAELMTLHVGDLSVAFPENSGGDSSFNIPNVDVSWTDGETLAARITKSSASAVSTDATLASLAVSGAKLSPAFDAGVLVYRANVGADTEAMTLSATTADDGATVSYGPAEDADAQTASHQVATPAGETLAEVTVTAADGRTARRYRVVLARAAANAAPTGLPAISGTPEVGETLTASVAAIEDADGTEDAVFVYQWLTHDGTDDTAISGATGATHEVAPEQAGKTLKVRVTFTDDKGTEEMLTSAATETVVDRRPVAATLSVGAGAAEAGRFRLGIAFGDAVTGLAVADLSASRVGGDTAAVSELTEAETGRVWTAWVAAADAGRYTVRLAPDAASSGERLSLAAVLAVDVDAAGNATAVAGPVVTSIALAMAPDGGLTAGNMVRMTFAFSEAVTVVTDGGTPSVGITLDGTARRAAYAGGTGTASLAFAYTLTADDGTVSAVSVTADSLALNGGTIRDAGGRDADLAHPGVGETAEDAETESASALTGLVLVDTASGAEAALADGDALVLEDPSNASYGLAASVAADAGVGSVRLALTGAKTVTVTDNAAPYSLYGDENGTVTGAGLPVGSYTLSATAYAGADGGGAELGTLEVSFRVAAGEPVDPDALTASFEGVPASHDGPGSEAFTFRVRFSQEPRVSYKVLRDESFAVTGGVVKKARRVDGRNDLREIHIEPSGWNDVTVTLPGGRACGTTGAICTADGKVLANTTGAVVRGPLALSVADAQVREGPNALLAFEVTLNRAASETVTVDYATSDGTATAGADYTATSGTLTFLTGETQKTVSVPVLDDIHDDDGETLTLTLSDAVGARIRDAEALGTIENSDPLPKAWLARFGRTVANHVLEAVRGRMSSAQGPSRRVTLGGTELKEPPAPEITQASPWDELTPEDQRPEGFSSLRMREFLLSSSFEVPLAQNATQNPGPGWTAWGGAARTSFSGRDSDLSIDGDVTTATLGVDRAWDRLITGVALARSTGDGSYNSGDMRGDLKSSITSAHPYLRFSLSDRLSAWTLLGYGKGELTLTHAGGEERTDIEMKMAALGARGALLASGGFDVSARTDALLVRTSSEGTSRMAETEADVSRLRLVLEGSRPLAFASGSSLTPSVEVGVRRDGGDAERGVGFEVGGAVRYVNPSIGLTVEITARRLMAHEQDGYSEWGAGGSVQFAPGGADRGFSAKLGSSVGTAASGVEGLWAMGDARGLAPEGTVDPGSRLTAELGYGFAVFDGRGVAIPHAGWSRSGENETLRLGQRLRLGVSEWQIESEFGEANRTFRAGYGYRLRDFLDLNVEASRREAANDDAPEHEIGLRARVRW